MHYKTNKAKCLNCGDIIESKHRHDFVTCSCFEDTYDNKGIFIDGGLDYLRRGGCIENMEDLSEIENEERHKQ